MVVFSPSTNVLSDRPYNFITKSDQHIAKVCENNGSNNKQILAGTDTNTAHWDRDGSSADSDASEVTVNLLRSHTWYDTIYNIKIFVYMRYQTEKQFSL